MKTQEDLYQSTLLSSSPIQRKTKKQFPHINQVVTRKNGDAALNFANFDLKKLVFEPHTHTNGRSAPFGKTKNKQLMVAYVFFGSLHRSYLSNKNKKKQKVRLSICWWVHDKHRVKKSPLHTKIERGQATAMSAPWLAQLVPLCIYVFCGLPFTRKLLY